MLASVLCANGCTVFLLVGVPDAAMRGGAKSIVVVRHTQADGYRGRTNN
jgi:hypothetical protein